MAHHATTSLSRSKSLVELRRERLERESSRTLSESRSTLEQEDCGSTGTPQKTYSKDDLHASITNNNSESTASTTPSTMSSLAQRLGLHKLSSSNSRLNDDEDDMINMTRNRYIQRVFK